MEKLQLTDEKREEILSWFWNTSAMFILREFEDFKKLLNNYPEEISFAVCCMIEENMPARAFINIMNHEDGIKKLLEFTRERMKKISKTKTKKIMCTMQDKHVAIDLNISNLDNYHGEFLYQVVRKKTREELLSHGFKSKKYPKR